MARKEKERLRTIQLDLDVSEIAQKLADQKKLSSTISELLRTNYGFGDKLEEKKRELHNLLDHKQTLVLEEKRLIEEIDAMEIDYIERETNLKPILRDKIQKLHARISLLKTKRDRAIDVNDRISKSRGIEMVNHDLYHVHMLIVSFA